MTSIANNKKDKHQGTRIKMSVGDRVFDVVNVIVLLALCFIMLYPMWYVLCASLTTNTYLVAHPGLLLSPTASSPAPIRWLYPPVPAEVLHQGRHGRRCEGLSIAREKGETKMSFDIVKHFPDKAWLDNMAAKLDDKMAYAVGKAREVDYMPYSTENGQWKKTFIGWWTNGFWPATMWQMYRATGKELYREEALRAEKMLDEALRNFKDLSHDVGFMWLIHSGVRYQLEKNQDSYDRTLFAANTLAGRFNPTGFIRAWNGSSTEGWAIVDCMMNLPILYWASKETGDPRYKLIAMIHADTTMRAFVRPDGSCNHIVCFDPTTGEFLDNPGGQGYESGSSWSRGQSWALYGFTLSYLHTGKQEYLDTAKRIANYFISQITDDYIPRCDFRQPAEPVMKDNVAGNVAACGLLELCQVVPELEAKFYYDAAVRILMAQEKDSADWSHDDPAIFQKCTAAYHDVPSRHMTMNYGDYYFVEAIGKLRGEKLLFWYPNREE